jgi:hypothetical protein
VPSDLWIDGDSRPFPKNLSKLLLDH